jgi:serine-type D-Ala-D-Ala carboxypeptidase/endopeptidase (penicillin-binding protein 4)
MRHFARTPCDAAALVQGASGRMFAVAMMVNHPEAARATPALDRVIEWIARSC